MTDTPITTDTAVDAAPAAASASDTALAPASPSKASIADIKFSS